MRHLPFGSLTFPAARYLSFVLSRHAPAASRFLARFSPWLPDLPVALAAEEPDLLFAWNITLEGLTSAVSAHARDRNIPWIGVPLLHLGRPRFYTMRHQLNLLRGAAAVLAQTSMEKEFLVQTGFAPGKVHVVGPGVDLGESERADGARFRAAQGLSGPLVLFLGALAREKGAFQVLEAMRCLWDRGLDAKLILAGPGTAQGERAAGRSARSRSPLLRALGTLSESDKWDAIDAADVVVMPSCTESFGLVYLEAWARRKPVVGARVGAVPDVIEDGVDGLLVRFGDVAQLSAAISSLLEQPERGQAMGQRGYDKVVRGYQWRQQYERLRSVVGRVTAS